VNVLTAWLASLFCLCTVITHASQASEAASSVRQEYLNSLISISRESGLANKRTWQVLLHYRSDQFGSGVTSEIDGAEFFLASTGKTNPNAELEATLRAFFSNEEIGKDKLASQCAFPARYKWLNSQLRFDARFMPIQKCEPVDLWLKRVNAESVSLIFSSYYFNNPVSMFGHTLLRINSAEKAKSTLLDIAINYAAIIDDTDGFFVYAWKGLTGGFEGQFSVYPYYDLVKRYNDLENRDLWEYQLNLSKKQIDFMLLHARELSYAKFDFFFMRENCSYHLLSLLEVADPELHLRDQYWAWTLPTETIKQINSQPGLVESIVYRPSLGSQLDHRLTLLSDREKDIVKQLIDITKDVNPAEFDSIVTNRQALILDAAINFIQYEISANENTPIDQKENLHSLLIQRSQLSVSSNFNQNFNPKTVASPDLGHDPARFEISGGRFDREERNPRSDEESFVEFSIRPGFHDLLSLEDGHAPNSQINFLDLRARYETKSAEWELQNFTLLDIVSLYPLSSFIKEPSWKIDIGWEVNQDNACEDCTPFILNPGIGLAFQSNFHRKEIYFAFIEANLEFDHEFDSDYRGGFGATVGLLLNASDSWRMAIIANRTHYSAGQSDYVSKAEFKNRFHLSRNLEIIFDLKGVEEYREGKIGFGYYF